jgi:carbon monoxide dehydrogenase subunit G
MAGFTLSTQIAATPDVVFDFMTNPDNAAKIMQNVTKMETLTPGPLGVGARYRETRRIQGKEQQTELTVVAYDPPHRYAVASEQSGIRVTYNYQLASHGQGTRIDLTADVTAGGLKKLVAPIVMAMLKKEDGGHLEQLKKAVEMAVSA